MNRHDLVREVQATLDQDLYNFPAEPLVDSF